MSKEPIKTQESEEPAPEPTDVIETVPPSDGGIDQGLMEQAETIADSLLSNPAQLQAILRTPSAQTSEEDGIRVEPDPAVVEAMDEFKFGTSIPLAGHLEAAYAFKYALDDKETIVWDLLLSPMSFEEALTKFPLVYDTPFGPINELGYLPWYKIVGMTYDEANKRIVPVKLLMMTPSFAFKGIDAVALSNNITTSMILETIDAVETHRALVVAEEARTARKEATTYKQIVDRVFTINYSESVEDMVNKAKEAEDKGDDAMSTAFKVQRDIWTTIKENWCIILFIIIMGVAFYMNSQTPPGVG
jgi:hypothetical protein